MHSFTDPGPHNMATRCVFDRLVASVIPRHLGVRSFTLLSIIVQRIFYTESITILHISSLNRVM